jgi:hypothetical protein
MRKVWCEFIHKLFSALARHYGTGNGAELSLKVTAKPSTHLLGAADSPEMYLGLLAPAEEYNMYVCVAMAAMGNPGRVS